MSLHLLVVSPIALKVCDHLKSLVLRIVKVEPSDIDLVRWCLICDVIHVCLLIMNSHGCLLVYVPRLGLYVCTYKYYLYPSVVNDGQFIMQCIMFHSNVLCSVQLSYLYWVNL